MIKTSVVERFIEIIHRGVVSGLPGTRSLVKINIPPSNWIRRKM